MALLFIKKIIFPREAAEDKLRRGEHFKKSPLSKSPSQPLLSHANERIVVANDSDDDVEARAWTSYNTIPVSHSTESLNSDRSNRSRINPRIVSDSILGLSDGLTVPFALSAGLSALGNTKVVILGGLAELAAGALSMGLGGYVGARSESESYDTTVRETQELIDCNPIEASSMVHEVFEPYGLSEQTVSQIDDNLRASPSRLLEFLITFYHKETQPDCNQAYVSAITLAIGYFVGGFIPLIPYFCVDRVDTALYLSIAVMGVTLLAFGYVKTCIVRGWSGRQNILAGIRGGIQMVIVGGVAAGAAVGLVRAIDTGGP